MLTTVWAIIAPVLLCAGVGFFWARAGKPFDTRMVTSLVTLVTTPCLIVATMGQTALDLPAPTAGGGLGVRGRQNFEGLKAKRTESIQQPARRATGEKIQGVEGTDQAVAVVMERGTNHFPARTQHLVIKVPNGAEIQ